MAPQSVPSAHKLPELLASDEELMGVKIGSKVTAKQQKR